MKNGFIKVGAASPNIRVADTEYNAREIIKTITAADKEGVKVLVLPELCVTAYTCGDLFLQTSLIAAAEKAVLKIASATKGLNMLAAVGLPILKDGLLYNCAAVLFDGRIIGVVPKKNIPNYSEFYEKRHFAPAPQGNSEIKIGEKDYPFGSKLLFETGKTPGLVLACEICEDLWVAQQPSVGHCAAGANVIINLSASDETVGKDSYRRNLVKGQSARLVCGYVFAAAGDGESTTDMVFGGQNIIAENGTLLAESKLFENSLIVSEIDIERVCRERARMHSFENGSREGYVTLPVCMKEETTELTRRFPSMPFVPDDNADRDARCEYILSIQACGLKKRIEHTAARTAVIGVSGGLDSSLALLVAARAMKMLGRPSSDIIAVTMPCFGTTKRTKSNAVALAHSIGATFKEVDITAAVKQHFSDIGHDGKTPDVTYENNQARERTKMLMDIANMTGGMVIGTGDLSELALGWATYNGDHMSMYGVNCSIPKTLIRHLVRYEADKTDNKVLYDVLDTPVSPELLPPTDGEISQKTEELVGPYELHDFFLYYGIRYGFPPEKVLRIARQAFAGRYDRKTILKWMQTFYRRFFTQQFKRSCIPDGPKVGSVTLSPRGDWRMPSDGCANAWLAEIDSLL